MHHSKAPDPQQELHPQINSDSLPLIKGLDTPWYGWRIRHPQASNNCENLPHIPKLRPPCRSFIQFRGMGREPKKTPRLRLSTVGRCLAATRSATVFKLWRIPLMIYIFLIQHRRTCRLADLRRIRTISAVADTEAQARANLPGLPLVFVARIPCAKRGQA